MVFYDKDDFWDDQEGWFYSDDDSDETWLKEHGFTIKENKY